MKAAALAPSVGLNTVMSVNAVLDVPEQGQLVQVRERRWVVADVQADELPADSLQPTAPRQHLLTLRCVDDDAEPDETLEVVWEIEPGARAFERSALPRPTTLDDPKRFDAFLDAVRWGSTSNADPRHYLAPFQSGVEIDWYQLDPLVRAIRMPRVSLLIADDVGLGKTIEAGLVAQELLLRYRARRILIVTPADLRLQWRDEMRDKFQRRRRPVVAKPRQRTLGVRRQRPHAPSRRQHQRLQDRRARAADSQRRLCDPGRMGMHRLSDKRSSAADKATWPSSTPPEGEYDFGSSPSTCPPQPPELARPVLMTFSEVSRSPPPSVQASFARWVEQSEA